MLYNIKIPNGLTVIQQREHVIEIKSQYHYWRLTENDGLIILAHKYQQNDPYHKQFTTTDASYAVRYIIRHDAYYHTLLNQTSVASAHPAHNSSRQPLS